LLEIKKCFWRGFSEFIVMARQSISEATKLQLWVKSAGRCEFRGCNKPVWYNGLTLSEGNFSQVAHIIASSEDGPRGGDQSENLQVDFSNLMLLCQPCHKEIDNTPSKYPVELLRKWKAEHEDRIEMQTSYPEDISRSTMLVCTINIGDRLTPINQEAIRNAMFPKFPTDPKGIKILEQEFDRNGNINHWQNFAEEKIKKKLQKTLEEGVDEVRIKHLSIFAIAPMPLLFFLGKCIGDPIPCDIYQSHRNIENTSKTWNWQESNTEVSEFRVNTLLKKTGKKIILKLAISDSLMEDKYSSLLDDQTSVYEIAADEPSPHFLKTKYQLQLYSQLFRRTLNEIQATHGKDCDIFILPAVPISIAIESGRVLLPSKDPNITICEYYSENGYKPILKLN
jgi:hypothetical protein